MMACNEIDPVLLGDRLDNLTAEISTLLANAHFPTGKDKPGWKIDQLRPNHDRKREEAKPQRQTAAQQIEFARLFTIAHGGTVKI